MLENVWITKKKAKQKKKKQKKQKERKISCSIHIFLRPEDEELVFQQTGYLCHKFVNAWQ